ncbi:LysR family transcriptional regulator [Oceanicella sp. SM1341]|uniref:LysR family transcriptional regulator n=1 Tax=Oceanicella sp. SM1341 TaxID=1548889 RepID=UPI000E472F71|nr:LysR family transcriptional regulator [Oceanicella sp. SM1341]
MARCDLRIELRHLRYFVAAAEQGSFRKAAKALGMQESAVSRRLRDLEDMLGASLFQRRTTGVLLTVAGQRFLVRARTALKSVHQGANEVAGIGRSEEGQIKIGIFSSLASGFLHELLNSYDRAHAGVSIDLINGNPAEHVAAVRQLRLDVAFITGTAAWRGCDTMHLWSERVFLVLPLQHTLAQLDEIEWTDVSGERFIISDSAPGPEIHDFLMQRLAELGRHPEIEAQSVGRDNLMTLVAIGRGLTLTSEATTAAQFPGVVYRPIQGEVLPFSAVWSPHNDNPASRRLISMARQMAKSHSASDPSPAEILSAMSAGPSQSRDPSR